MRKFIGTLVVLLFLLACTPFGQRILLFQISAWAIRDGGFQTPPDQTIQVGALQGYYFAPDPGQPTVYFAHGNSSRHARQVERLAPALEAGMGLYYVTYPGFDQNLWVEDTWQPQLFSEAGGKQALLDHWAAYLQLGGEPENTILAAESLGTAMMPWFAAQLPEAQRPTLLVLMAGFDEFSRVIQAKTFGLAGSWMLYDAFENTDVWPQIGIPTYVANGDSDWLVSDSHGRRAARRMESAGRPVYFELVEGRGHLDLPLGEVILRAQAHDFDTKR